MNDFAFYYHAGSDNHGCEAIVRGTVNILKSKDFPLLFSFNKSADDFFGLNHIVAIQQVNQMADKSFSLLGKLKKFLPNQLISVLRKSKQRIESSYFPYPVMLKFPAKVFLSIGGDNYCYGSFGKLMAINAGLKKLGGKTVLWGCSIEPNKINEGPTLRQDLMNYDLITPRESLTYQALVNANISKNVHLFPDPAFTMSASVPGELPQTFIPNNTVGINVSPLVLGLESENNIVLKNLQSLIHYILQKTDMNIALIPHVVSPTNNDLKPLSELYKQFKQSGRVCLIDKPYNAMEIKGIISQCRFMAAARTHASIAAYSTQVPTLVIGYSVKARGIARDIFGTEEGYVVPVQGLQQEDEITNAFINLMQKEAQIRAHYKEFMPGYIAKAYQAGEEVKKLLS